MYVYIIYVEGYTSHMYIYVHTESPIMCLYKSHKMYERKEGKTKKKNMYLHFL